MNKRLFAEGRPEGDCFGGTTGRAWLACWRWTAAAAAANAIAAAAAAAASEATVFTVRSCGSSKSRSTWPVTWSSSSQSSSRCCCWPASASMLGEPWLLCWRWCWLRCWWWWLWLLWWWWWWFW